MELRIELEDDVTFEAATALLDEILDAYLVHGVIDGEVSE